MARDARPRFPRDGSYMEQLAWRVAFDFAWVCEHLLRIKGKDAKIQPFVFNDVQRWVYWNILDFESSGRPVRLWILKGRQFGISTFFAIRQFVKAGAHGANCLILPHLESPGRQMMQKVELAQKNLPRLVSKGQECSVVAKPSAISTGDFMQWSGEGFSGLVKRESAENPNAGVSETFQHVHLTEVPLWRDASATMGGLLPTIPDDPDTTIVGEFTARGEGDYAHDVWVNAEVGDSPFRAIFLPWYWHSDYSRPRKPEDKPFSREEREYRAWVAKVGFEYPLIRPKDKPASSSTPFKLKPRLAKVHKSRDLLCADLSTGFKLSDEQLLWRRDMIAKYRGDIDLFRREYPAIPDEAFRSSGRRLVPPSVMDLMDAEDAAPVDRGDYEAFQGANGKAVRVYRKRDDGRVHRWDLPRPDATYVIGADPASGVGADYSAAVVLRVEFQKLTLVASYQGKERPHEFARILARMGQHYRTQASPSPDDPKNRVVGGMPSLLVVERNGFGEHVLYELDQTLRYRRLYKHDDQGKTADWKYKQRLGFLVSKSTKMPMLQHLVQLCFDGQLVVPCKRVRREIRGLVYLDDDDSTAGAISGAHDDLAMAIGEAALIGSQRGAFRRELYHSR